MENILIHPLGKPYAFRTEAVVRKFPLIKVFLKILQYMPQACNFVKIKLWHRCFPMTLAKILRTAL